MFDTEMLQLDMRGQEHLAKTPFGRAAVYCGFRTDLNEQLGLS